MDEIFEKKLISTKNAAELSGYSSDYLSRLARSGKIHGKRIGRSWFVDKDSLMNFLAHQEDRKIDYARALARARETEYREYNSSLRNATKTLSKPVRVPFADIARKSINSQAFAFSVATVVVVSSALLAHAAVLPSLADGALSMAGEAASGFSATFGNIPSNIIANVDEASVNAHSVSPMLRKESSFALRNYNGKIKISLFAEQNLFSSLRIADNKNISVYPVSLVLPARVSNAVSTSTQKTFSIADAESFALTTYSLIDSPSHLARTFAATYVTVGSNSYAAILESFNAYRSFIKYSGNESLTLASSARDTLAVAPNFISQINLAIGNSIIDGTHVAIHTDVTGAYGVSVAAPAVSRATFALVVGTGNMLAVSTARTPALATSAFLNTAKIPATVAPELAQTFFGAEYYGASRFVAVNNFIAGSYMLAIQGLGEAGYGDIANTRSAASRSTKCE